MEPLQDGELMLLAKDVPHIEFSQLCDALGNPYGKGQKVLTTCLSEYDVAVQQLLMEWKMKQTDPTQSRPILARKLRGIGLGALGDKLSQGGYQPNQCNQRDNKTASLRSSSDIYSVKISESLTVGKCREKLVNKYRHSFCKIQRAPWDPNDFVDFEDLHTVVTVVKKDAHGKDTRMKEILHGSVGEIFSTKVNGVLPLRILICAPAGRGKTTAVAKMAYDWANRVQGSSLENLPLLFAVKLRNTNQQTSIAEAIRSQLLSDVADLTQEGLHRFIEENQGICHILLDGLDEYAGIAAYQGLKSNIVDVMLWEEFPDCRVLVTTRPHLEMFFYQEEISRVYAKMWIAGFSRDRSREYIDRFFALTSNPSNGQGLKAYLDDKPLLNELVITPLFCHMVCYLWSEEMLGSDTITQTELLDTVNLFFMHRANARSRDKITEKKLHKIICKLGEVALAGLLDDEKKVVFTPYDFRKFPAILDEACELGIISKTIATSSCLPANAKENTSTTIEFYHKLARDHSAGKSLADQTKKYLLRLEISKLDQVLRKIRGNIWEYENLIRFAAGTNNSLCIRIMEAILSNSFLDESERYRILLDCSSETSGSEGSVSSLIQRCVAAQRLVLKSPTVFTVVGMQNLPEQLKSQIQEVKFHYSFTSADVTSGLWSCLGSFSNLRSLAISDSSLSFPPSPPEVQSVTQLVAKRVTSHSYDGLLSSLPDLEKIDITIDDAEQDIPRITAGLRRTRGQQKTCIILQAPQSLPPEEKKVSRGTVRRLGLLIREQTKDIQMLGVSGIECDDEDLIYLVQSCRNVKMMSYLVLPGGGSEVGGIIGSHTSDLLSSRESLGVFLLHDQGSFFIEKCQASTETTIKLWSYLKSFTTLIQLTISESSLSFPPSPPKLPSITKLVANKVPSSSYKGLLSSIPALKEIDITIDDAEQDIPEITDGIRQTGRGKQLTHIGIQAPPSVSSEKKQVSRETMRGLGNLVEKQTKNLQMLCVSGVKCKDEEDLVDLVESCRHVKTMDYLVLPDCGFKRGSALGSHTNDLPKSQESLKVFVSHEERNHFIEKRQLSPDMILTLWSCLRHLSTLDQLTISDSSLTFPSSPPELPFITKLETKKVTSESYKGLLSSLPGLKEIDITIDDAEKDLTQIMAGLRRTGGQQLTDIRLRAPSSLPSRKKKVSGKTMRELGLLIRDQIENVQVLGLSGVHCQDEDDLVDLVESCRYVKTMDYLVLLDCGSKRGGRLESKINELLNSQESFRVFLSHEQRDLCIEKCQLSTEMTTRLWSFLRSFISLDELKISDSSLSFPPSPPELSSVKKITTVRVTSESFKDLFSSLPGLKEIDITTDDAEKDITQITAGLRQTGGQQLTDIRLRASSSLPSGKKKLSSEAMRELGLLFRDQTKNIEVVGLSGVQCQDEDDLVDLVESCRHVKTMDYLVLLDCGSQRGGRLESYINELFNSQEPFRVFLSHEQSDLSVEKCQLSTEMTTRLWSFLRSFTALDELNISNFSLSFPPSPPEPPSVINELLNSQESFRVFLSHEQSDLCIEKCQLSMEMTNRLWSYLRSFTLLDKLKISDSSLSFPPSPTELPFITKLETKKVTSESYKGLLSSLPSLKEIDITIEDAERDITQITTGLRRSGGQQLTDIRLRAPSALPSGKKKVSAETMRGLGHLIRDQTKKVQVLGLSGVQCQDENDLVDLVESCRHVKTMDYLVLLDCGSNRGGRLESYINELLNSQETFSVFLSHKQSDLSIEKCQPSKEMTTRLWSFLKSFTSLDELRISDSSLIFPPSPPELPSVKKLTTVRVTSESFKGLLLSLPGLKEIDITIDDAERDISQITAGLRRTGGQQLTDIRLHAPSSLPSGKKKVSRKRMRELGYLIRGQIENIQVIGLFGVQCQDEDDLVDLVESVIHVKKSVYLELIDCGSKGGGRLESYINEGLSSQESFRVFLSHSDMDPELPMNPELDIKGQYPESSSSSSATATDTQPQSHDDLEHSTNGDRIIRLDEYSVEVRIPPDEADGLGDVAVEALTTTSPDLVLNENEVVISVGLKVSSSKRTFKTPVKVTLPHCGSFTHPEEAELVLYNRATDSDSFVATPCTAVGIPRCVVREKDLDLYIGHFSESWITVIITKVFIGKYVFFTPYIPVEIHKNEEHFLHLCIKDENNRNEPGIEDHKIVYRRVSFFVNWWRGDIAITYRQDEKEKQIENIPVNKFHYCTDECPSFPLNIDDVRQSLIRLSVKQKFTRDMADISVKFYIYIKDNRLSDATPPATPGPSTEAGTVYMYPGDEEEVTDECLFHVSKNLLPDQFLAVHIALGIKYSIAADIREKNIPLSEKYYDLFQKWKVQSRRTVKALKEVLAKANAGGLTS